MNTFSHRAKKFTGLLALSLLLLGSQAPSMAAEEAVVIAAPVLDVPASTARSETAIFAGGCFWGVQGVFQHVRGVTKVLSGYTGGAAQTAHYETVGSGTTGHAEAVHITYDPAQITYGRLLQVFFSIAHNPTQLNRQGPDHGAQYRSAVFPLNPQQRKVTEAYIVQLDATHAFKEKIATRVEEYKAFYPAEAYHQDFLTRYPTHPYIAYNDMPKVENLKRLEPKLYRADPVLALAR